MPCECPTGGLKRFKTDFFELGQPINVENANCKMNFLKKFDI